jgi:hypothetical protein
MQHRQIASKWVLVEVEILGRHLKIRLRMEFTTSVSKCLDSRSYLIIAAFIGTTALKHE